MSRGRKKAIVGEHSIFLSMIALDEGGGFEKIKTSDIDIPSLHAIRMARNLALHQDKHKEDLEKYEKMEKLKEKEAIEAEKLSSCNDLEMAYPSFSDSPIKKTPLQKEEIIYRKALLAPLSEKDRKEYFESAKLLEAKLRLTKQKIAEELEVDLQDVAFIPQRGFHIDLELCAMPDGGIFLHDPQLVEDLLQSIPQKTVTKEDANLIKRYISYAKKETEKNGKILQKTLQILKEHHITFECLPAVFRSSKLTSQLNYCNGIFLNKGSSIQARLEDGMVCFGRMRDSGGFFVTTGPSTASETVVHDCFVDLFNKTYKNYTCVGIDGMSAFIEKYSGGVRCLSLNVSPPEE